MAGTVPGTVYLYRILHIDNLEYLLTHGIFTRRHPNSDPGYINIGDTDLISKRDSYNVKLDPPGGVLGDYIPFYFGPLSPMLYNIKNGYKGVTKRPQNEIIYIVCRLEDIIKCCKHWFFTDGHAKAQMSFPYNDIKHLNEIDWDIVGQRFWNNTEDDIDRVRRKQAEFLVKDHVPVECIRGVAVFDEASRTVVENIIRKLGLDISVKVNPGNKFYY